MAPSSQEIGPPVKPGRFTRLSPDNRWLSYTSYESGQAEVYVQPWPALDRKIPISVDGGAQGVWSRDSRRIYYRHGPQMLAVDLAADGEPSFSPPRLVFEHDYGSRRRDHFSYDVAPDGRFIMTLGDDVYFPSDLQLVLNWDRELDARLGE